MQIKEATEEDIPRILEVLKASLGESSSKKTEEVWRFKHVNNPFGKSLVLIAVENDQIIGVRAFMRWQWQCEENIYSTFRAVDTATHPRHQGKGVFKKLTLEAIEVAKQEGGHFIFNTPNEQSRPGYLKMGWKEVDKLRVQIKPMFPLHWSFGPVRGYQKEKEISLEELASLCLKSNVLKKKEGRYFTPKTPEYLHWRYEENPLQDYEVRAVEGCYLAGYIKQHKYFKELRIAEVLTWEKINLTPIQKIIESWARKFGVQLISMGEGEGLGKIKLQGNYGPVMTVRNLNLSEVGFGNLENLHNYNYNLGDLELF